jgi:hypothetical protein
MHIYIHTRIYISCISGHLHIHNTSINVYTNINKHIHTYIYSYIHTYIHTYIHIYIRICIHTRIYISSISDHLYVYINIYTSICIRTSILNEYRQITRSYQDVHILYQWPSVHPELINKCMYIHI